MTNLGDQGNCRRNCFFVGKIDRWSRDQGHFGSSLGRAGRSGYSEFADFQALRLGHVTGLPDVP